MSEIYFTKVEYRTTMDYIYTRSRILLNLQEKELSYQVFEWNYQMPAIQGIKTEEWNGKMHEYRTGSAAKIIKTAKTNFEPQIIVDEGYEQKVLFSYGKKLSDEQIENLRPYCNALDFEPYRNKTMSMCDEGFVGYRDEVQLYFRAVSDSYLPQIELPMNYFYDEEHIWPSEKLYRYLIKNFFEGNKELKKWEPTYGGFSLFY